MLPCDHLSQLGGNASHVAEDFEDKEQEESDVPGATEVPNCKQDYRLFYLINVGIRVD